MSVTFDFFFSSRRRHTRWTGDWSSDVCSSDLKIRKIREVVKKQVRGSAVNAGDAVLTQTKNEYFIYSDKGFYTGNRALNFSRSEERRVGKECRFRCAPYH